MHISLCTLKKEIKKKKLEIVPVFNEEDKTRNKSDETVVKRLVTITSSEEDEFVGSVPECAAQFTSVVNRKPWLSHCPSCSAAAGTSSTSLW